MRRSASWAPATAARSTSPARRPSRGASIRDPGAGRVSTAFSGAIFDVDGVLVDSPHERAWREALRELFETRWSDVRGQTTYAPELFTPQVYQQVVSGRPRMDGALAALEYFHVPQAKARMEPYADRKQQMVLELIGAGEFTAFPDALCFVLAVRAAGIRAGHGVIFEERQPDAAAGPPRHVRRASTGSTTTSSAPASACWRSSMSTSPVGTSRTASRTRRSSWMPPRSWAPLRWSASWSRTPSPASRRPRQAG